jgi:hypothetical protein
MKQTLNGQKKTAASTCANDHGVPIYKHTRIIYYLAIVHLKNVDESQIERECNN